MHGLLSPLGPEPECDCQRVMLGWHRGNIDTPVPSGTYVSSHFGSHSTRTGVTRAVVAEKMQEHCPKTLDEAPGVSFNRHLAYVMRARVIVGRMKSLANIARPGLVITWRSLITVESFAMLSANLVSDSTFSGHTHV